MYSLWGDGRSFEMALRLSDDTGFLQREAKVSVRGKGSDH